jgi:hypothetical protein
VIEADGTAGKDVNTRTVHGFSGLFTKVQQRTNSKRP